MSRYFNPPRGSETLSGLKDLDMESRADGRMLSWSESAQKYIHIVPPETDPGATTIADLTDVDSTGKGNNRVLVYNAGTGKHEYKNIHLEMNRVFVTDFGVVGDRETDDTQAILDAVSAAEGMEDALLVFPPNKGYRVTQKITIPPGIGVEMQAPIYYDLPTATTVLEIGAAEVINPARRFVIMVEREDFTDWTNKNDIGVLFINPGAAFIEVLAAKRFYQGVVVLADGEVVKNNHVFLGNTENNRYHVVLTNKNGGSVQNNTIYGGRNETITAELPPDNQVLEHSSILITSEDGLSEDNNSNLFLHPGLRVGETGIGVDIVHGKYNKVSEAQFTGGLLARFANDSGFNIIETLYSDTGSDEIFEDSSVSRTNDVIFGGLADRNRANRTVYANDNLRDCVVHYTENTFHVPGLSFRNLSGTDMVIYKDFGGITLEDRGLVLDGVAIGIMVDTSVNKKFDFVRAAQSGVNAGRLFVQCFDEDGQILTGAGLVFGSGRDGEDFMSTSAMGGAFYNNGDVPAVSFTVADSVKQIWVGWGRAAAPARLAAFRILTSDSGPVRTWAGYPPDRLKAGIVEQVSLPPDYIGQEAFVDGRIYKAVGTDSKDDWKAVEDLIAADDVVAPDSGWSSQKIKNELDGKANVEHTHQISEVNGLDDVLQDIAGSGVVVGVYHRAPNGTIFQQTVSNDGNILIKQVDEITIPMEWNPINDQRLSDVEGAITVMQSNISSKAPMIHTHSMADITDLVIPPDFDNRDILEGFTVDGGRLKYDGETVMYQSDDFANRTTLEKITETAGRMYFDGKEIAFTTDINGNGDGPGETTIDDDNPSAITTYSSSKIELIKSALEAAIGGKANMVHDHEMADINGLAEALAGKADEEHFHEMSDIIGLSTALGEKAEINDSADPSEQTVTYSVSKIVSLLQDKVDKVPGKGLSTNDFTDALKLKLEDLENYTHPTGDGNLHVPATGSGNGGKVLVAGDTPGSISWKNLFHVGETPPEDTSLIWLEPID